MSNYEPEYLKARVREETEAAELASNPVAAAAHVELANRYLAMLNGGAAEIPPAEPDSAAAAL